MRTMRSMRIEVKTARHSSYDPKNALKYDAVKTQT
jgi:hypothetical protein